MTEPWTHEQAVGELGAYALDAWTRLFARRRVVFGMSVDKRAALGDVAALVSAGVLRPVVDRIYPLARLAEAHRYVESGRKRGNVVISVAEE